VDEGGFVRRLGIRCDFHQGKVAAAGRDAPKLDLFETQNNFPETRLGHCQARNFRQEFILRD
jgi:hypothetical protein